jgi:hypothetical protein
MVTPLMSAHGVWCEPGSFNLVTDLMDTCDYAKRLQESTDPLKYRMDIRPSGQCYMEGETLHGYVGSTRRPPPGLLDVEEKLLRSPTSLVTITGPIHGKSPVTPPELQNKLVFKECKRGIGTTVTGHRLRSQMPNYAPVRTDIILERRKQVDIARNGRNTRQEMKDAYSRFQKRKFGKRVEGVYVPSTALDCVNGSDMGCVHVAQKDAASVTGSTVGGSATSSGLIASISTAATSGNISAAGSAVHAASSAGGASPGANGTGSKPGGTTKEAVSRIPTGLPFSEILSDVGIRKGGGVQFYAWKSPCAKQ